MKFKMTPLCVFAGIKHCKIQDYPVRVFAGIKHCEVQY